MLEIKIEKKKLRFQKEKKIATDTEIGPWFRFPIPKPGFGRTLLCTYLTTITYGSCYESKKDSFCPNLEVHIVI